MVQPILELEHAKYPGLLPRDAVDSENKNILSVFVSDTHCGSKVSICPEEGVELDDGGMYIPSYLQKVVWNWWLQFWEYVGEVKAHHDAKLVVYVNGDATDGHHPRNSQLISMVDFVQIKIARDVFTVPDRLGVARWYFTRGTPVHSGTGADLEEQVAAYFGAMKEEEGTSARTHWNLYHDVYGFRYDAKHHGKGGRIHRTRGSAINLLAQEIWTQYLDRGQAPPHLAVRSHVHTLADSGPTNYQTRAITLPPWSLKNDFAEKVAAEAVLRMGGVLVLVEPDGTPHVDIKEFTAEGPKLCKMEP